MNYTIFNLTRLVNKREKKKTQFNFNVLDFVSIRLIRLDGKYYLITRPSLVASVFRSATIIIYYSIIAGGGVGRKKNENAF